MTAQASKYDVQAQTWADKWGVRMDVVFAGHRKYFADDKDTRDTYSVTLKRGNRSMTFDFGASLNDSKQGPYSQGPYWSKWARDWNIICTESGSRNRFRNTKAVPPSLYDVLTCFEKYDPGTFEEWCSEFGYDPDSRKALDLYLVVQKQARDFLALCGNDAKMIREAQEIQ